MICSVKGLVLRLTEIDYHGSRLSKKNIVGWLKILTTFVTQGMMIPLSKNTYSFITLTKKNVTIIFASTIIFVKEFYKFVINLFRNTYELEQKIWKFQAIINDSNSDINSKL